MSRRRKERGFTLIELLLVVVIIGILAALVIPNIIGRADETRMEAARSQVNTYHFCLDAYKLDNKAYPPTQEGLAALITPPPSLKDPLNSKWPYLKEAAVPKDPWGNDYGYEYPSKRGFTWPDVFSWGPDGQPNTEDDIYKEVQ